MTRYDVAVVTWSPGGNLPSLDGDAYATAIRHALDRLLHEPGYAGAAGELAVRIAAERPDTRAAAALERCAAAAR